MNTILHYSDHKGAPIKDLSIVSKVCDSGVIADIR